MALSYITSAEAKSLQLPAVISSIVGAVAAWGGTGLGLGAGHHRLSAGFYHAVFADQVETLGEATLAGKLILASTGQDLDLLDTYVLLGDPALRLNRALVPWTAWFFLPLVNR